MTEWAIRDVTRASGLTSRALRHYERIGLLRPSRVAGNGYRFYSEAEMSRLYRILSLRGLGLPLAVIRIVLDDDTSLTSAIESHLSLLEERRDRANQQINLVQQTLERITKGRTMSIEEIFAGVEQNDYESEVRARWGDEAWERSAHHREQMNEDQRKAYDEKSFAVNVALRKAAEEGLDPASSTFQTLVNDHHRWVTDYWGGRVPDRDSYAGLAELYVADDRFAAVYGGEEYARVVREAIRVWISVNLT